MTEQYFLQHLYLFHLYSFFFHIQYFDWPADCIIKILLTAIIFSDFQVFIIICMITVERKMQAQYILLKVTLCTNTLCTASYFGGVKVKTEERMELSAFCFG